MREAGKLIEKFFAAEREKIKALVESQATSQATEGRAAAEAAAFNPRSSISGETKHRLPVLDGGTVESLTGVDGHGSGSIRTGQQRISGSGGSGGRGSDGGIPRESGQPSSLTASIASPLTAATSPAAASPREGRARLIAAVAAATVGAIAAVAFFSGRGGAASAGAAAAPTALAPAAPTVHTLLIDSTPQGATVREGDKELGKTPMTLDLDPTVTAPRRLVMALDGYAPHTFFPTREGTQIMVPLAPIPAAPVQAAVAAPTSAPASGGQAHAVTRAVAPPPPPPTAKPAVPSDINMVR